MKTRNKQISLALFLLLAGTVSSFSQVRIVVMGSSTAEGIQGPSMYDSSFVGRLIKYYTRNTSDGLDTIVENIAYQGLNTYNEMPNGFVAPPDRPGILTDRNVTWALRNNPAAIIINLPTNDMANGYTKKEYMNNLRTMYNAISSKGTLCYVTTTQPRELTAEKLDSLRTLVDSIKNSFGIYSIDFWTDIYLSPQSPFKPEVRYDGIHVNDIGHRYLFNRVIARLFLAGGPLPIKLNKFGASLKNRSIMLKWQTDLEEKNTVFELQRSGPDNKFTTVYTVNAAGRGGVNNYEWTDLQPLQGDNLYRLKILEPNHAPFYSKIQGIRMNPPALSIDKISTESGRIAVEVSDLLRTSFTLNVFNHAGALVYSKAYRNPPTGQPLYIPASLLTPGVLLIRIEAANGQTAIRRFMR